VNEEPARRPQWKTTLQHAIGPLVLLLILYSIDYQELRGALGRASSSSLLLAAALMLPPVVLRALRWRLLLGPTAAGAGFGRLLAIYAHAIFVGSVTPGRLGEFVKVVHVTRLGASRGEALMSVLTDRLYDVVFLAGVGAAGLWALALSDDVTLLGLSAAAGLVALGLWAAWHIAYATRMAGVRSAILERLPERLRVRVMGVAGELRSALQTLSPRVIWSAALLTASAWALAYLANYLVARSLGLDVSYLDMAAISAICSLVALLPISVLGAGTRDAVLIVILARYGGTPAEAVALSTLMLALTLWTALACGVSRPFVGPPAASAEPSREG
jgi:uncharacterized protein (TIRG00374 family)